MSGSPEVISNTLFEAVHVRSEVKETTLEELISRGMELRESKDDISWQLGDLAQMVTSYYGTKELDSFSKGIGIPLATIRRYRDVSKAYEPVQRNEYRILSWSHFRQVAALPDRLDLLKRAADENWSVEKLIEMSKRDKKTGEPSDKIIDDGQPVPPKPELLFCTGCRKWYIPEGESCPSQGQCPDVLR